MIVVPFSSGGAVDYDGSPLYKGHRLRQETVEALADENVVFCDLHDTWDGYWVLLEQLWVKRKSFVICEQDMQPHPGAAQELLACPRPWCSYPYDHAGRVCFQSLGFAKFSGLLCETEPDIFALATEIEPSRHWGSLDVALAKALGRRGYGAHRHLPMMRHLMDGRPID